MNSIFCFNRVIALIATIATFSLYSTAPYIIHSKLISPTQTTVTIGIPLTVAQALYTEYLSFTTNSPDVIVKSWNADTQEQSIFDPVFKKNKQALTTPSKITVTLEHPTATNAVNTSLCMNYYLSTHQSVLQQTFVCSETKSSPLATAIDASAPNEIVAAEKTTVTEKNDPETPPSSHSWSSRISELIANTQSMPMRVLLAFLLGLLMSLTPCIYPMIPITAGILQSQATKSIISNIALSLSYTTGIATTFAVLGLLAAYTGQLFGSIMANPIFIITIVALLVYLALAMMGFYEMYIPRIFQPRQQHVKGGSYLSAFLFGAASGTFASPCLSPGLLLLLTIVTTLKSTVAGFLLLFAFGVGISVPLLIVGSFSSSLMVLPRAGMWMVEVKKLFGLIMIGMSFYFLSYILPLHALFWIASLVLLVIGVTILYNTRNYGFSYLMGAKKMVGFLSIIGAVFFISYAISYTFIEKQEDALHDLWLTDYAAALRKAVTEKKMLLVDVGAPFCSSCNAIDKTLFSDAQTMSTIVHHSIPLKLDGSDGSEETETFNKRYSVKGFPTIVLIDPTSGQEMRRWGSELCGRPYVLFINDLKKAIGAE